jgi:hypothetical protein
MNYSIDKNIHTHTDKEIKSSSLFVHNIWNESIIGMKKKKGDSTKRIKNIFKHLLYEKFTVNNKKKRKKKKREESILYTNKNFFPSKGYA